MLTIQMPDGHDKKRARKRFRAGLYFLAGVIIMTALFLAFASNWWYAVIAVEVWWVWAALTDPALK